jgi:hypothetical protein
MEVPQINTPSLLNCNCAGGFEHEPTFSEVQAVPRARLQRGYEHEATFFEVGDQVRVRVCGILLLLLVQRPRVI